MTTRYVERYDAVADLRDMGWEVVTTPMQVASCIVPVEGRVYVDCDLAAADAELALARSAALLLLFGPPQGYSGDQLAMADCLAKINLDRRAVA